MLTKKATPEKWGRSLIQKPDRHEKNKVAYGGALFGLKQWIPKKSTWIKRLNESLRRIEESKETRRLGAVV